MSERRRRRLDDEERALWERTTRAVRPLLRRVVRAADAAETPAMTSQPKPASPVRAQPRGATAKPAPKPATNPQPKLAPLDRRQKKRLARGTHAIDLRIDLHGHTRTEAHAALLSFLRQAQGEGARFVLVITGKGTRAGDEWSERGVLKRQVPLWLELPEFRSYVIAFEDAHLGHGGDGAIYVRVRKRKDL